MFGRDLRVYDSHADANSELSRKKAICVAMSFLMELSFSCMRRRPVLLPLTSTCRCCGDVAFPNGTDMPWSTTYCFDEQIREGGLSLATCAAGVRIHVGGAVNQRGVAPFPCYRVLDGGAVP